MQRDYGLQLFRSEVSDIDGSNYSKIVVQTSKYNIYGWDNREASFLHGQVN